MDETDKKIRELTEAMRAEWDVRIRNRMVAVRRVLAGYPHAAGRLRIRAGVERLSTIRTE